MPSFDQIESHKNKRTDHEVGKGKDNIYTIES
jgi:hypothetical protein